MDERSTLLKLGECGNVLPWGVMKDGVVHQEFDWREPTHADRRIFGDQKKAASTKATREFLASVLTKLGPHDGKPEIECEIKNLTSDDVWFILLKIVASIEPKQEVHATCPNKEGEDDLTVLVKLNEDIHVKYPEDPARRLITVPLARKYSDGEVKRFPLKRHYKGDENWTAHTVTVSATDTFAASDSINAHAQNMCDMTDIITMSHIVGFGAPLSPEYEEEYGDSCPASESVMKVLSPDMASEFGFGFMRELNLLVAPFKRDSHIYRTYTYECAHCGAEHEGTYDYEDILSFFLGII